MQGPHGFIDPIQLRPCLDVPTHSYAFCVAEEGIMGNADHLQSPSFSPLRVHVPLPQRVEVLGLYLLSPYCPCTQMLKSENLYKPIYFETADYGTFTLYMHSMREDGGKPELSGALVSIPLV